MFVDLDVRWSGRSLVGLIAVWAFAMRRLVGWAVNWSALVAVQTLDGLIGRRSMRKRRMGPLFVSWTREERGGGKCCAIGRVPGGRSRRGLDADSSFGNRLSSDKRKRKMNTACWMTVNGLRGAGKGQQENVLLGVAGTPRRPGIGYRAM
jgi:hypothetical protein